MSKDVRRLLAQSKSKRAAAAAAAGTPISADGAGGGAPKAKRIDSPLARYDGAGRLSCVVCRLAVKTEALWATHLAGKQHKESVERLKRAAALAPGRPSPAPPPKDSTGSSAGKRVQDPGDDEDAPRKRKKPVGAACGADGRRAAEEESNESHAPMDLSEDNPAENAAENAAEGAAEGAPQRLPADFFDHQGPAAPAESLDEPPAEEEEEEEEEEEGPAPAVPPAESVTPAASEKIGGSVLPSDFFDDPEAAPVGLVPPDQRAAEAEARMETEWAAFQKSIAQAAQENELIAREEVEAAARERMEDEQLEEEDYKERLARLRRLKNLVFEGRSAAPMSDGAHPVGRATADEMETAELRRDDEPSESDSDEDIEAMMDWRTKAIV